MCFKIIERSRPAKCTVKFGIKIACTVSKLNLRTAIPEFTVNDFCLCRPLKCSICNALFRTEHLLRRHITLHEPRERKGKLVATNPLQPPRGRRRAAVIRLTAEETQVLAQQPLDNAATVSEKVLIASVAEKDRISELKVLALVQEKLGLIPNVRNLIVLILELFSIIMTDWLVFG